MTATEEITPRARRHPERGAARAALALRRHVPPAAHRRPRRRTRARPATAARRRQRTTVIRSRPRRLDHGRLHLPRPEGARRPAELARQLRAGVPRGDGRPRGAAGRRRRQQPGALGEAARHQRRPRRPGGALPRPRAAAGRGREGTPRARGACRRRGDLAPGLLPAPDRADVLRLQGRDRPAGGRRERQAPLEPEGAAAQGGRDHPRLPGRDGRAAADADAGGARPKRHLRRLPQAAHEGGGLPAVPPGEGGEPRGGGAARREDGRALAERRSARALPGRRRPGPRRRPAAQQRLPLRRRSARASSARPARTRGARIRATRSTATAASTCACTA